MPYHPCKTSHSPSKIFVADDWMPILAGNPYQHGDVGGQCLSGLLQHNAGLICQYSYPNHNVEASHRYILFNFILQYASNAGSNMKCPRLIAAASWSGKKFGFTAIFAVIYSGWNAKALHARLHYCDVLHFINHPAYPTSEGNSIWKQMHISMFESH